MQEKAYEDSEKYIEGKYILEKSQILKGRLVMLETFGGNSVLSNDQNMVPISKFTSQNKVVLKWLQNNQNMDMSYVSMVSSKNHNSNF